ncbi:MAG: glutamate 5-kinase [Bacteroidales bacterium]|nr:glutamate 5-kinase [Bacteroidales bacterium]MBN2821404.1 glutamate 5-kinase [Bacteroidales bacterium]
MKREAFKDIKKVVIKVGTSTLSYQNGRLNFQRMEKLAYTMSAIRNKGYQVVLVSSGAIGVGAGRLGMVEKPKDLSTKQALAAIGQAQLVKIYQKMFEGYNQTVAQVLLTKDVMLIKERHTNAQGTLYKLMDMGIIPIVNENDTISTDEIVFGDNDTLSAMVATLIDADLLILLSDIDGLYSADPKTNTNAEIIRSVTEITPELEGLADGSGSSFGTGGMITKISAARITSEAGIDTIITNGDNPEIVFDILEGKEIGTHFIACKEKLTLSKN